jgi:predicted nucleic acid-binding protein
MPEDTALVINTGPLLALIAALGDLSVLCKLYDRVVVPSAVAKEVLAGGQVGFGIDAFREATFLEVQNVACHFDPFLKHALDEGEASVIQTAQNLGINTVCIDENAGRRIARLYGLSVTGSLGILIKAIQTGKNISLKDSIDKMRMHGIWISDRTVQHALQIIKENP